MQEFKSHNLSAIFYANGFTQWHYRFDGDGVPAAGHFSPAWKQIRLGDQIDFVSRTHAGTLVASCIRESSVTAFIGYAVALADLSGEPAPCK